MDAYGWVWLGMGTHVYVLVYTVTHGYKWVYLGIYESVWQAMSTQNLKGMYWCMWVCMDIYGYTRIPCTITKVPPLLHPLILVCPGGVD